MFLFNEMFPMFNEIYDKAMKNKMETIAPNNMCKNMIFKYETTVMHKYY